MDAFIARVLAEGLRPSAPRNRSHERSRRNRSFEGEFEPSARADAAVRAEPPEQSKQLARESIDSDGVGDGIDVTA
ncbi:MAG: hypothetical protein ACKVWV_18705 [Planctomycetota bacterium]